MKAVMASGLVRDGMALELVDASADVVAEVVILGCRRRDDPFGVSP